MIQTTQQLIKNKKKKIKEKSSRNLTFLLESKLFEHGIDRVKYHGGDLEGTSILKMFQNLMEYLLNSKKIFQNRLKKKINWMN